MGWKRIGGLALALAMMAGDAEASTPFNLGAGLEPDVKIDSGGKAHVAWVEECAGTEASPGQIHYCRIVVATEACEAKAVGGPHGIGNYPHQVQGPAELFFNPLDGKPRLFVGCYNCDHGGAQTSELIVAAAGTSMARRTTGDGADPEGGGMVGNLNTEGQSAYDPATDSFFGTDIYYFQKMPTADPSDDAATRLSPYSGGSGSKGAVGIAGGGVSQVQVAVYTGVKTGDPSGQLLFLTHSGQDGVNVAANWAGGTDSIGAASDMAIESAGSGVTLLSTTSTLSSVDPGVQFRRFDATTKTFSAPVQVAARVATGDRDPRSPDLFEAPNGRLYAAWFDSGRIRFSTSADGVSWTFPETLTQTDVAEDIRVAGTGEADRGFVVWGTNTHQDGVIKATALSPILPMACPGGDPRCPISHPEPQPEPPKPQEPQAPPQGTVKKGTLGQFKYTVRAPSACVPAGARIHVSVTVGKNRKKVAKRKRVRLRSLSLWLGAKRIAQRRRSPLDAYQDSTGLKPGAVLKYQLRIVYRVGKSRRNKLRKFPVTVRIC